MGPFIDSKLLISRQVHTRDTCAARPTTRSARSVVLCASSCPRVECMRGTIFPDGAPRVPAIHAKEVGSNNAAFGNLRPVPRRLGSRVSFRVERATGERMTASRSVESVVNASAVVGRAVGGLRVSQFPALLGWLTSRYKEEARDDVEGEMEEQEGETSAAVIDVPDDTDIRARWHSRSDTSRPLWVQATSLRHCPGGVRPRVVGPVAAALRVRAALLQKLRRHSPRCACSRPLEGEPVLAALRRGWPRLARREATFYIACLCVAQWQNVRRGAIGPPPFSRTQEREWRRETAAHPRRHLPIAARLCRELMHKEADLARDSPRRCSPLGRVAAAGGVGERTAAVAAAGDVPETARARRAVCVPYAEISRGDIEHWCAARLCEGALRGARADEAEEPLPPMRSRRRSRGGGARGFDARRARGLGRADTALDYGKGVAGRLSAVIGECVPRVGSRVEEDGAGANEKGRRGAG